MTPMPIATAAAFLTGDRVLEDLSIEERLDAAIDRSNEAPLPAQAGSPA